MSSVPAYRRHDISDKAWEILESHLPGRKGTKGCPAHDNRNFINAVFWILITGAPWRDLPPDYRIMGTGKIQTDVFAAGVIGEYGQSDLNFSPLKMNTNG